MGAQPFSSISPFQVRQYNGKHLAVRITLGYRALGIFDNDTVMWFWIGGHDEYDKFFS
jgi:hypothetical protein